MNVKVKVKNHDWKLLRLLRKIRLEEAEGCEYRHKLCVCVCVCV